VFAVKRFFISALTCILLFILLSPCFGAASGSKLRVAFRNDTPYQYIDDQGKVAGLHVDILNEIAKTRGYSIQYMRMQTMSKCLQALEDGAVDAVLGVKVRDNKGFLETVEISSADLHMMISKSYLARKNSKDIRNYNVAFENNTGNYLLMHNLGASMYLVVATQEDVLDKFIQGKADAILLNEDSIRYSEQKGVISDQLTLLYKYVDTVSYTILVSDKNRSLLRKLNDGIVNLKVTGEYEGIRNKWIPDDETDRFYQLLKKVIYALLILLVALGCYLYLNRRITMFLKKEVEEKTERLKQTNEELEHNIAQLKTQNELRNNIIQNSPNGMALIGDDWTVKLINRNACLLAGIAGQMPCDNALRLPVFKEILGPLKDKAFAKGYRCYNQKIVIEGLAGDSKSYRYDIDQVIEYEKVAGILVSIEDITGEEERKKEAVEREKNQALNRMIAGIAHEIKNPLMSILTFASMIDQKGMDKEFQTAFAKFVPSEVGRMNSLIESLINYAKPVKGSKEVFDVREAIEECLYFANIAVKENKITLVMNLEDEMYIKANRNQVKQALINIIMNGIEAIEKKLLEESSENHGPVNMEIATYLENGNAVIMIYDEGIGMDFEEQEKYSEPFYTTKDRGTGLGMAMATQYIKENGGLLRIQSEKNKYTKIIILFRRYDP
jgi:polar amino acid transport system substrate-binding protein